MLRRFFSCALLLVFLSFAFAQSARAGTFYIKSVGTLDVSASGFNHLWYNSGNVTVTGSAAPGETVSVTVDGTAYSAVADAQGSWSHTLTLSAGDHTLSFSAPSGSKSFTLTNGPLPEDVDGTLETSSTPVASSFEYTLIISGAALLLISSGLAYRKILISKSL